MCRDKFLSKKRGRENKKFAHTGMEYSYHEVSITERRMLLRFGAINNFTKKAKGEIHRNFRKFGHKLRESF